jgi:hypothetical protein
MTNFPYLKKNCEYIAKKMLPSRLAFESGLFTVTTCVADPDQHFFLKLDPNPH